MTPFTVAEELRKRILEIIDARLAKLVESDHSHIDISRLRDEIAEIDLTEWARPEE